jgi:hypothetical protein
MSYKSARKWKNAQFDKLLNTCEMMSVNNINSELIKYYNDQQYKDIMNKYNIKLEKIKEKNNKKSSKKIYDINYILNNYSKINNYDNINFID